MNIEDDIRNGIREERLSREREQREAAERDCQARDRAAHAARLMPYLERYRDAARRKYGPTTIECVKPRIFRSGDKVVYRSAWRISTHYGGLDNIGQQLTFILWLDDTTSDLWWQQKGLPAHRISLGENNPDLSPDEGRVLEEAEKELARNLGKIAERNGIELFTPGR